MTTTAYGTDQRRAALDIANGRRTTTARIRRNIHALSYADGRDLAARLLRDPSAEVGAMPVRHVVESVRKVGVKKAGRWYKAAGVVTADRRVRDLTDRQRRALADLLAGDAA